jgi:hypothetical protein
MLTAPLKVLTGGYLMLKTVRGAVNINNKWTTYA